MTTALGQKPHCCIEALGDSRREMGDRLTALAQASLDELAVGTHTRTLRDALLTLLRSEIIPWLAAQEELAEVAAERTADATVGTLARALPGHHRALATLADELDAAANAVDAAAAVGALVSLCLAQWESDGDSLIPGLAAVGADLEPLVDTVRSVSAKPVHIGQARPEPTLPPLFTVPIDPAVGPRLRRRMPHRKHRAS